MTTPLDTAEARRAFVRAHTVIERVPFVPELRIHTATEVTSLWSATSNWLGRFGADLPFWSVPWAGGQALARWLFDHPKSVRGRTVLDFGTGSGLVAMAAVRAGAAHVCGVDVDPLACEAARMNAEANGLSLEVRCADLLGPAGPGLDEARWPAPEIVLAGDVWYDRELASRAAPWLAALAAEGVRVVTGDPGRAYVPVGLDLLASYDVPTSLDLEASDVRRTVVAELRAR